MSGKTTFNNIWSSTLRASSNDQTIRSRQESLFEETAIDSCCGGAVQQSRFIGARTSKKNAFPGKMHVPAVLSSSLSSRGLMHPTTSLIKNGPLLNNRLQHKKPPYSKQASEIIIIPSYNDRALVSTKERKRRETCSRPIFPIHEKCASQAQTHQEGIGDLSYAAEAEETRSSGVRCVEGRLEEVCRPAVQQNCHELQGIRTPSSQQVTPGSQYPSFNLLRVYQSISCRQDLIDKDIQFASLRQATASARESKDTSKQHKQQSAHDDLSPLETPVKVPDTKRQSRGCKVPEYPIKKSSFTPAIIIESTKKKKSSSTLLLSYLDFKRPSKTADTVAAPSQHSSRKTTTVKDYYSLLAKHEANSKSIPNQDSQETQTLTHPIQSVLSSIPQLTVSNFDLKATVGTGTFGRVRVATLKNVDDRTPLALKILKKTRLISLKQLAQVKSEKEILTKIKHPFIVNMFASFQDEYCLYMVMDFVLGGELFSYLKKEGKLGNDEARFYAAEIILALQYLHHIDIIYRDLKPENLLIDGQGHIKIADFGFAKEVKDRTWTVCGTPEYMAPEVFQHKGHGKSADWWSLGVLIYEMLVGSPPFYADDPEGIYTKILLGRIKFPRSLDTRAKDLIKRLLSHDRTKRFGCLKAGAEDVKRHKWFGSLDWNACLYRKLSPPFVPKTSSPEDTCMFDDYPESSEGPIDVPSAAEQQLFADF